MNYIKELNAFRDWAMLNRPSTGQVALWYSLMSINNMTGWETWFTVPNQTLQLMTGLSRQGLDKARNGLIQMGRIEYRKGRSNQAGSYRIIPFFESDSQKVGTQAVTQVGAQVDTQAGTGVGAEVVNGVGTGVVNGVDTEAGTAVDSESNYQKVVTLVDAPVGTEGAHQLTTEEAHEGRTSRHTGSTLYKLNKTKLNETKKEKKKESSASPSLAKQVQEIWDHYLATFDGFFPRGITLTKDRRTKIEARLKEGCTVEDIKLAITNIRKSPFHCGDNDRGKFYADITFICRNRGKVEEWMNYQGGRYRNGASFQNGAGNYTPHSDRQGEGYWDQFDGLFGS